MTTEAIAAYFQAIRDRNADALLDLFTDDVQLTTVTGTYRGHDEIVGFYRDLAFSIADLWPEPGPLIVDDDRVAVEIDLTMGGATTKVADVFTMRGDRIARLAIYSGPAVTDTRTG
jgi:hypothetical protein